MKEINGKSKIFWAILLLGSLIFLPYSCAYPERTKLHDSPSSVSGQTMNAGNQNTPPVRDEKAEEAKKKAIERAEAEKEAIKRAQDEKKAQGIARAKDELILQVAAEYVNSELVARERENLLKQFRPERDNIIRDYKIVSDSWEKDGSYQARISAEVRVDLVRALLMKNLHDGRVIVITSEKNLGKPIQRLTLEHDLVNRIRGKGYQIVDYGIFEDDTVRSLIRSIRQGSTEAIKKLGIYCLTNVVAVGFSEAVFSQKTREIYSALASGRVTIHQIGAMQEISSSVQPNVKGFGSNEEKAGLDALMKLSVRLAEEAVKDLPQHISR